MQMNAGRAWPTLGGSGMRKILSAISDGFLIRRLAQESTEQDGLPIMTTRRQWGGWNIDNASILRRQDLPTRLDSGRSKARSSRVGHGRLPPASAKKPFPVL